MCLEKKLFGLNSDKLTVARYVRFIISCDNRYTDQRWLVYRLSQLIINLTYLATKQDLPRFAVPRESTLQLNGGQAVSLFDVELGDHWEQRTSANPVLLC
jgi:hypothetical protein